MSKERVETFSDGVFAIAITLLVLTIAQPDHYNALAQQLVDRWPELAAYIVSFAVIGIMWLNHHSIFTHFGRVDRGFIYLNLVLLMSIVFIPYPTGIFGQALQRGQGAQTAAVLYSVVMTVNAYAWSALWLYASSGRRLLTPGFPEEERHMATVLFTIGGVLYTLTIGIAFISAYACLAAHGLLAVYYALDPLSRRAARSNAGAGNG
ncbi:MAG: TMEM175 family protein [Candidatus Dormibacteria bacterium]